MDSHPSRTQLLAAAAQVIRAKGYSATRIEDICAEAKLTKGSFFHHFKSKEELAIAAADQWTEHTGGIFATAPYRSLPDPRDRVLGYVAFRRSIITGPTVAFSCLVGTMVQEVYDASPAIRAACERSIDAHVVAITGDLAEAKRRYAPRASWRPEDVALYTQAVLQGAFILAKAKGADGVRVATACVDQLRDHVERLLPAGTGRARRGS